MAKISDIFYICLLFYDTMKKASRMLVHARGFQYIHRILFNRSD